MNNTIADGSVSKLTMVIFLFFVLVWGALCAPPARCDEIQTNKETRLKIEIVTGDTVLTATMLDTETSRHFLSLLPMKLVLKDYAGTEKISDLAERLTTTNASPGYKPSVGDITYYAPWGNIAIFYKNFGYAKGLVHLGILDGGIERLANRKGDFEVIIQMIGETANYKNDEN